MAAVDAMETWDSNQPRLQTAPTKEGRQHLQAPNHLVFHTPPLWGEGADAEAADIVPLTHAKNGIIGTATYSSGLTCQNGIQAPCVPGDAVRMTIKRGAHVKNTRIMCKQDEDPAK